jgi:Flp pilus assembly protein TadG
MGRQRPAISSEEGYTLIYMAVMLTGLLLFSGLAIDTGRAYIVRAQLSKAVDGAALGAARNLNAGDPKGEASRIFNANFPLGFMGTNGVTNPSTDPGFFKLETVQSSGVNVVTVAGSAKMPTTFMSLANFKDVTVRSSGEATRRMVDLSLVLDVSGSIGARWPAVRDAARAFVESFDAKSDRLSLVLFSSGARVVDQMPSSRGFDKSRVIGDIPNSLPGGSTAMAEGLYRGWDELRAVPGGQQSSLRVIVLFTDGAPNGVPGIYDARPGSAQALITSDFPRHNPDPGNHTTNTPILAGLYDTGTLTDSLEWGTQLSWNSTTTLASQNAGLRYLPAQTRSFHGHRRSAGIPSSFPLQTSALTVNGIAQSANRPLRNVNTTLQRYPADVWNTNNAARNLVEIIADAARSDNGDYRVRIYTIGMGELIRYRLGTSLEKSEDLLMRVANDARSLDFNEDQLEGKYYFAETEADVAPAFQALQSQIVRLTK